MPSTDNILQFADDTSVVNTNSDMAVLNIL